MNLQDLRIAVLTRAPRPNIFDLVALILVIGAMVLLVYGGEQTTLPLSARRSSPLFIPRSPQKAAARRWS
jgi:NitT/TauT family transport system permease protein